MERDAELHKKVDLVLFILRGNGEPDKGLVTKHAVLAQRFRSHEEEHASGRKDNRWVASTAIAIGCLAVAIFALLK